MSYRPFLYSDLTWFDCTFETQLAENDALLLFINQKLALVRCIFPIYFPQPNKVFSKSR